VRDAERLAALGRKLPEALRGETPPAGPEEQLGFARVCKLKMRYAAATHFYAGAFTGRPNWAGDLRAGHRYDAACSAALAAADPGAGGVKLDDEERGRLRKQALDWLRADLASWGKQVSPGTPQARVAARRKLLRWRQDGALAGVRDAAALANLPQAERAEWQKLWADVAALLKKAEAGGKS
jgi:serine/threonine-protein kinase